MSDDVIDGIFVTARNHQFVSEATGLTLLEVHQAYQDAQDAGEVCVLPMAEGHVRNIFESVMVAEEEEHGTDDPGHRRKAASHDAG